MNTKTITFSVIAALFIGAYVALCSIGLSDNACLVFWLSIAFAAAAILCAAVDYYMEYSQVRSIRNKIDRQESDIQDLKKVIETMKKKPKESSPEEISKRNGDLQEMLKKLTNFGEALNQVKKELEDKLSKKN